MTAAPWYTSDPALPAGAVHALGNYLNTHHSSWNADMRNELAYRIVSAPRRQHNIDGILANDALQTLEAIDTLVKDNWMALPLIAEALNAGIPLDDLTWLIRQKPAWQDDVVSLVPLALVSGTSSRQARRLALVIIATTKNADPNMVIALVEALETGHEEVARYVLDGMPIRDAVRTVRAQDTIDRTARPQRTLPVRGR